jgi:DNA invertase Pin-like site-specific DNA recombinase
MLTVLGGLAEFERELIKARTAEGRQRAKARGMRFGRKLKLSPHQRREALARRDAGEALTEIGRTFGVAIQPSPGFGIGYLGIAFGRASQ